MLLAEAFFLSVFVALTMTHPTNQTKSRTGDKPHILLVLIDDLGWGNVGYHRDDSVVHHIDTPTIDQLATEDGLELDQHYANLVCGPSRASLMSGRFPIHVNVDNGGPDLYNPDDPIAGYQGIPPAMTGLAQKLKSGGYATHQVGKWDVGMATTEQTAMGRGFDSSYGYFHHSCDYYTHTEHGLCNPPLLVDFWENDGPASLTSSQKSEYVDELFRQRVLEIIGGHAVDTPLFLYYAPHIAHAPLQVPDHYWNQFSDIRDEWRRNYTAMVKFTDDALQDIIQALKERNMWDNTLIVFSSDNGGALYDAAGANNFPLRGGKTSNWQGGVRVNAFVSGGYLPEEMRGQKKDGLVALCDWYATFCELAGVDPGDNVMPGYLHDIDSISMLEFITSMAADSPRKEVPLAPHYMNNNFIEGGGAGLIVYPYKILVGEIGFDCWTGPIFPNMTYPGRGVNLVHDCGPIGCLFNIRDDPEERTNLNTTLPAILRGMRARYDTVMSTLFLPDRGGMSPMACDKAVNDYGGVWGPFVNVSEKEL